MNLYHRTLSQFLLGLPAQPAHIAGISFTTPAPLADHTPHKGSGVYVWIAPPGDPRAQGSVVFAGMADDLARWDEERSRALARWLELGHTKAELSVAVHHMPHATRAELMALEHRLIALLAPVLNAGALNDSQQLDGLRYQRH
jgi:hypothetical protein